MNAVHPRPNARGPLNRNWKGGRSQPVPGGYVSILKPDHPRARGNGYVYEHTLVAEAALGRLLPAGAHVHHVDENKSNNARGNLVICQDGAYHRILHQRQRAYDACGDASALKCRMCKGYDRQGEMYRTVDKTHGSGRIIGVHADCQREYLKRYRRAS